VKLFRGDFSETSFDYLEGEKGSGGGAGLYDETTEEGETDPWSWWSG